MKLRVTSAEEAFDLLVGQAAHLVTQISTIMDELIGGYVPEASNPQAPAYAALHYAARRLVQEVQCVPHLQTVIRAYAAEPPIFPSRDAPRLYGLLSEDHQKVFTALTANAGLRWWIFANRTDSGADASFISDLTARFRAAQKAADALMHLDCLIRGWSSGEAASFYRDAAEQLIACFQGEANGHSDSPADKFGESSEDYDLAKRELRYLTIDLGAADMNPDRGDFEDVVKHWVSETLVSAHADRFRHLWKRLFLAAGNRFQWSPPSIPVRRISLAPADDPILRQATRVLAMVGELHKAGYQRIRALPMLSPSGCYWRCCLTYIDNIASDGFTIRDFDVEGKRVAVYSTGQGSQYFDWEDARKASARQLAALFLERYPLIAALGSGRDWAYAGWLTDVLGRAEAGGEHPLLYLMADFPLDKREMEHWRPPPPAHAISS